LNWKDATMLKPVALAAVVVATALTSAHAVVISDTMVDFGLDPIHPGEYAISGNQVGPSFSDMTTLWSTKQDHAATSTLTVVTFNLDQGADFYLADAGATFTPAAIADGQFKTFFTTKQGAYALEVPLPGEFYLGIATTAYWAERTVWGWVHLQNDASGLTVLGSAMAYGEGGGGPRLGPSQAQVSQGAAR
jgi:hypothetical protein